MVLARAGAAFGAFLGALLAMVPAGRSRSVGPSVPVHMGWEGNLVFWAILNESKLCLSLAPPPHL